MLMIEDEGMFHITLIAVGMELDSINIITMNMFLILPTGTNLLQSPKSTMEDVVLAFIQPTVLYIILFSAWHIIETIAIVIMVFEDILMMQQYLRCPLIRQMNVGIGVCLDSALGIAKEVYLHLLLILRLQVIHIDLTCNRLIAILHRSTTLGYLNAFHPRSRHIAQGVWDGCTTEIRQILGEHLYVSARKTKEFDLSCARRGIIISHIHRWIGRETLAQVATSRLEELILIHGDAIHGTSQSGSARLASHHLHLLQGLVLEDGILRGGIYRVIFYRIII